MNAEQIVNTLYSWGFAEGDRLRDTMEEKRRFITPWEANMERVMKFIEADLKHKHFIEFRDTLFMILRYYDGK